MAKLEAVPRILGKTATDGKFAWWKFTSREEVLPKGFSPRSEVRIKDLSLICGKRFSKASYPGSGAFPI